jgi:cephalosporin-C deacetylase-like acetyl esterase
MEPLNRFPQVMQEYLVSRVREVNAKNLERIMSLRTKKDALAYQDQLRRNMHRVFGRKPGRTPLNPRITGVVERDEYRIEKVIIDSRPGLPVTGNLYVPKGRTEPGPAVLGVCGHSGEGKGCDTYQSFSQGLAKKGYVVFIFDPLSQGERIQYPDGKGGSHVGGCCAEHNFMGRQNILTGPYFGSWRVWDGMRAMDYLLSRPEVDPECVGLTGNSGGGTMTTLILANDDRFAMGAPSCYITSWRCNAENELPADAEQQPPWTLGLGMEMGDLLMLQAPKPLIVLTQESDYFDQRGALDMYDRLKRLWKLLGAEDNVEFFTGPRPHGYWIENREAMYGFFNKHAGVHAPKKEPAIEIEEQPTLWCTASGQVDELKPATVSDFVRERSRELAEERGAVSGDDLLRVAKKLLDLPKRDGPPDYRVLRPVSGREWPRAYAASYVIETEPDHGGRCLVYKLDDEARASRPLPGKGPATLYLPDLSSDAELRDDAFARKLTADDAFFACDYRGIGEQIPNTCGGNRFADIYGSDYFYASYAEMFGQSYLAWRVHDVLCALDFMAEYGYDRVHLAGAGRGGLVAAFAGLVDERVRRVTLKGVPISYAEMAETRMNQWTQSSMLPDVLGSFDLPDVYRALYAKKLSIVAPVSAEQKRMAKRTALARLKSAGLKPSVLG